MKVLDIIEECQSEARKTPKENAPAVGKHTAYISRQIRLAIEKDVPCLYRVIVYKQK